MCEGQEPLVPFIFSQFTKVHVCGTNFQRKRSLMLDRRVGDQLKIAQTAVFAACLLGASLASDRAEALTAGDVLENLNDDQWFGYVSGLLDGLATARWLAERPDSSGMRCIYEWYTARPAEQTIAEIEQWFGRHPEQQAGLLLHVLIAEECPSQ